MNIQPWLALNGALHYQPQLPRNQSVDNLRDLTLASSNIDTEFIDLIDHIKVWTDGEF